MVKIRFLSLKVVVAKAMDFASYFLCLPSGGEFREIQVDSHKCIQRNTGGFPQMHSQNVFLGDRFANSATYWARQGSVEEGRWQSV